MQQEHLLHLFRVHVEPGDDHEILGAIHDEQVALVVSVRHVAGMEPPIVQDLPRFLRTLPVPGEHVGASDDDLARVAVVSVGAVDVEEPDFHAGKGQPHRGGLHPATVELVARWHGGHVRPYRLGDDLGPPQL